MQNMIKYLLIFAIAALAFSFQACLDLLDGDSDIRPEIVFGDNIEGVRVWDDSSTVIRKLGKPSQIIGSDLDCMLKYQTGMQVIISRTPLLGIGMINMMVAAPYKGRSKEGIGIGTERDYVLSKLGGPDVTSSVGMYTADHYHYEKNFFSIEYIDNKVQSISMFVPVL